MARFLRHSLLFVLLAVSYRFGFASDAETDEQETRQYVINYGSQYGSPYGSQYGSPYGYPGYPGYQNRPQYYIPDYRPAPAPQRNTRGMSPIFLAILLYFFQQSTTTAATTTTPATTPDTCFWSAWTACSATCGGTRSRSRTCSGVVDSQYGGCNDATGFQSNGWYRAANCYEYSWRVGSVAYAAAVTGCTALNARLASTGMRNASVRGDVLTKLTEAVGVGAGTAYIGVTDADNEGTYVWSDGVIETPTSASLTGVNTENCITIAIGNPFSMEDVSCTTTTTSYLCERAA